MESLRLHIVLLVLTCSRAWENTHQFKDVCVENGLGHLYLGELNSSAVVALSYPIRQRRRCGFTVSSSSRGVILVVRLLNLRRSEGVCGDYILLEGGISDTFQYHRPWCTLHRNESSYDIVQGTGG